MSSASLQLGGDNWAAKDGNLLGYQRSSSSSVHIPHEFTFTRGSNLAATRVAANGLIEKGRENLATYSNDFSNAAWTMSGSAPIGGQDGYDGSNDAWSITGDVGDNWLFKRNDTIIQKSGIQTFSIYVKKNATYGIRIYFFGTANANTYFNLSNGTIVNASNTIDSKIEPVGSDWFRCSITFEQTTTQMYLYATNNENVMLDGITHILQDAQLEQGLAATDYIETGASTVQAGLLEDEPRIDYTGGTGSLLLEPSRTQLIPYTEYLSGLSLSGNPPTITQNYAVSPEGVQNAVRIQDTDATNYKIMQTQFSVTAGSTYTISVYVKKASSPISTYGGFYFDFDGGTRKTSNLIFDEYNGTLVNASGNAITSVIHPVIDEGDYWRFSATATDTGSNTLLRPTLRAGASANGTTLNLVTKDYTAYGFQCEQGSYATSYIPNHSGGSVTRVEDFNHYNDIIANPIVFGANDDFTLYYEGSFDELGNNMLMGGGNSGISGGSGRSYWWITNTSMLLRGDGEIAIATAAFNPAKNTNYKLLVKRNGSRVDFFIDGIKISTNQQTTNTSFTLRSVGWSYNQTVYQVRGNIKQVKVFPTALSDAQCSALTVEGLKEEILTSYIAAVDTLEDGAEARLDTYLQNLEDLIV